MADVLPYTALFLAAGYYLGWLPAIWARADATAFGPLVLPTFMAMIVAYLYFVFRVPTVVLSRSIEQYNKALLILKVGYLSKLNGWGRGSRNICCLFLDTTSDLLFGTAAGRSCRCLA